MDYTYDEQELKHYGVLGMKWGKRKAQSYENKASISRQSAKEWKEIGKYKSQKLKSKGKIDKAKKASAKYNQLAEKDKLDARMYEDKLKTEQRKNKFREERVRTHKSRSMGAHLVTNVLAGAYANRTYNSVIAAGGTKTGARIVTGLTGLGGPLAHLAVSSLYTKKAGNKTTAKRY